MLGVGDEHPWDRDSLTGAPQGVQPPGCPMADLACRRMLTPNPGGVSQGADPPAVRTSCFPFIRQMLMSCWFERHVSFWGGAEKPTWGWGEASRPHGAPPGAPQHIPGDSASRRHRWSPGSPCRRCPWGGGQGCHHPDGMPPPHTLWHVGGGCVICHPPREMWGSGVGDEHHQGPSRCSS